MNMTKASVQTARYRLAAHFLLAVAIGSAGGLLFYWLHLPLPWMLGAMLASGLCAIAKLPLAMPMAARLPMTAVIGTMLGSSFTIDVFRQLSAWPIPLLGVVLYVATAGWLGFLYFRFIGRLDRATAFFSGMPGGVVEMVTLGAERGGDERMISLIHGARIFLVVMSTPFIVEWLSSIPIARGSANWVPLSIVTSSSVGWFAVSMALGIAAGKLLRLPARYLLGPMLVSALLHVLGITDFKLPSSVIAVAQVVLGSSIGCRFAGVRPGLVAHVFLLSIGATTILLMLSVSFSLAISYLSGLNSEALAIAYSPGGLPEMSLIALSLNVSVVFVVVHHLTRVLLVVAGSSAFFGLIAQRQ